LSLAVPLKSGVFGVCEDTDPPYSGGHRK